MNLPKGNPLIESVTLPVHDIETMITNLETDGFTGYLRLDMGGTDGLVFFTQGDVTRAMEFPTDGDPTVRLLPRVINLARQQAEVPASTFVTSSQIVMVLSSVFAFKPHFKDYQVKRKEMKKVLNDLEQGECSGILRMQGPDGRVFLLMDRGDLVTDRFTDTYGEVVCGAESVSSLLDYVHNNGSTIQVYAEKASEIELRKRQVEDDLEKIRQLIVKEKSGMFRANDVVKVAEDIIRDWGIDVKQAFMVEVETGSGELFNYKCQAGRKLGGYAEVHSNMVKSMGVQEGDLVNVRPIV